MQKVQSIQRIHEAVRRRCSSLQLHAARRIRHPLFGCKRRSERDDSASSHSTHNTHQILKPLRCHRTTRCARACWVTAGGRTAWRQRLQQRDGHSEQQRVFDWRLMPHSLGTEAASTAVASCRAAAFLLTPLGFPSMMANRFCSRLREKARDETLEQTTHLKPIFSNHRMKYAAMIPHLDTLIYSRAVPVAAAACTARAG